MLIVAKWLSPLTAYQHLPGAWLVFLTNDSLSWDEDPTSKSGFLAFIPCFTKLPLGEPMPWSMELSWSAVKSSFPICDKESVVQSLLMCMQSGAGTNHSNAGTMKHRDPNATAIGLLTTYIYGTEQLSGKFLAQARVANTCLGLQRKKCSWAKAPVSGETKSASANL